jgi:hypothetical protein
LRREAGALCAAFCGVCRQPVSLPDAAGGMPVFTLVYNGYHYRLSGGKFICEYGETSAQQKDSRVLS